MSHFHAINWYDVTKIHTICGTEYSNNINIISCPDSLDVLWQCNKFNFFALSGGQGGQTSTYGKAKRGASTAGGTTGYHPYNR